MPANRGKQIGLIAGLGVGATLLLTDAGNGAKKRAKNRMEKKPRTNHELAARVCAELHHRVEHGKGIQVFADNNQVTLRGVALRDELDDVIDAVQRVRGVRAVNNKLDLRDSPGKVVALQS
ncbi:MAG TPA: BON domain-containing protein [Gemmatimonadaceae bacterium]|jgi:osmotically-inducible protein OsmY|nr:BON domain-containing protein [Gemmatimonadaceae bacterium]